MAHIYENKPAVPAIALTSIEAAGLLDKFPYCDLCNEQEEDFIYFPGICAMYCKSCADVYIESANLSHLELAQHQQALKDFVDWLKANNLWQ